MYFAPPLKGFSLELYIGAGSKKTRIMGLPARPRKKLDDIFSRVDRNKSIDVTETDGRMDTRATAKTALMHSVAR